MATLTVAIISHDRLNKLKHMIYEIQEQTLQPDKIEVYLSGYTDKTLTALMEEYPNIVFLPQPDKKDWGHDKRAIALSNCDTDYIATVNDDDQYILVYLDIMMQEAKASEAGIIYCDFATRTNQDFWIKAKPERGYITNGNMLIRQDVASKIPYRHRMYVGDWFFVEDCLKAGVKFSRVPYTLGFFY